MNPQAEAIQSAIEKLEALKAKCMPVTCRTLEDQADSTLAAIDVCRRFHEIQSDCLIQLAAIAADAGNSALTKNGIKLLMSRDDVNDVLYDAEQWAKEHAGDGTYSPRMHGTYSTLRGSVN